MRLGVLDVGSNTVHLLVVDAHPGANPQPALSHKIPLMLAELIDSDGSITPAGTAALVAACREALGAGERAKVQDITAFATSALREATNSEQVLATVREQSNADLVILDGADEAALTFLAVRRWFGWSAGRLLVFDIGGGSLEIAVGEDEEPRFAVSLPLGASRLTRAWFSSDPPPAKEVAALRRHVQDELRRVAPPAASDDRPHLAVATSKTFRSLARVAGAAPSREGPYLRRTLRRADLEELRPRLAALPAARRAKLPGVSPARALQLLAGAVVAEAALQHFGVDEVTLCPWALREGVILRRLDWLLTG